MKRLALFVIMVFILMNGIHGVNLSYDEISVTSKVIEKYTSSIGKIPNKIILKDKNISMNDYIYVASTTTINLNNNKKTGVQTNTSFQPASNPITTTATGTLYKTYTTGTGYLQAAKNIKTFMETNKRPPNYITTKIGKINIPSLIYAYAKIINFYNANKKLPSYVTITRVATPTTPSSNSVVLGKTDYGMVVREGPYGNPSSPYKVVFIAGVHPLEYQAHNAIIETIKTQNSSLKKRYYIYRIKVTKDASNYEKGRINGQLLANQYAVPDIKNMSPKLVIDVHSNKGEYAVKRFLFIPYPSEKAERIARAIKNKASWLVIYTPPKSSSPPYVTIPLIKAGIPSIVYETYFYEAYKQTLKQATQIVSIIDGLVL